jgi:hypothetical protein
MTRPDFTTTPEGNGILLRAHSKEARAWLRENDAELDRDGFDLDVWDSQTWLPLRKGYPYLIVDAVLDCYFTVEAVEPAAA